MSIIVTFKCYPFFKPNERLRDFVKEKMAKAFVLGVLAGAAIGLLVLMGLEIAAN